MKRLVAGFSALVVTLTGLLPLATANAAGANLITNPGLETAAGAAPQSWTSNSWGTNTAAFTYDTTGRTGNRAVSVRVSGYQNGDAKWSFAPVAITPGVAYTFSNWYKSTAGSGLVAAVTMGNGTIDYRWIKNIAASAAWRQQTVAFVAPANSKQVSFFHYMAANGSLTVDDYSLTADAATPPPANSAPQVSLTSPAANATVSGTVDILATASDDKAVANVQFKLNGANLGAADTVAPYAYSWSTTALTNGTYTLSAVATDNEGISTASNGVQVTVSNTTTPVPPANGNLIANPSVETANGAQPANWSGDGWGTNSRSLTYETNGQDGSRSVKATISSYTNGDAKWSFAPVTATPGATYTYSHYYKSNIVGEVDAAVTMSDGSIQYYWLGSVPAATNWTKVNFQFTAPANAQSFTIFHVINKVGYVQADNFSLAKFTPQQLSRGLVSLTFDDGWSSIHTNGLPLLKKYGLPSTQYINSTPVTGGYSGYMTYQMIKDFKAQGSELGWHTRSHADITTLTAANLITELTIPADYLTGTATTAAEYKHFASPYGSYNQSSVDAVMQKYQSHRSTDVGYNTKSGLDLRNIKVQNITNTTSPADVQAWVNQAAANKSWLVLVYHEVANNPNDPTYAVTPANLDSELNIIKQSGLTVKTVDQAIAEIKSQL